MILRRVIKHFRNQEWTAIFLDFLIVVVGVFVGLQVQKWNEARNDEQRAHSYLLRLHNDVSDDIEMLEERKSLWIRQVKLGSIALAGKDAPPINQEQAWTIVRAFHHASNSVPMHLRDGTYTEMVSSGQLGLIKNTGLRDLTTQYYTNSWGIELSSIIPTYRMTVRRVIPPDLHMYLLSCHSVEGAHRHILTNCPAPENGADIVTIANDLITDNQLRGDLIYAVSVMITSTGIVDISILSGAQELRTQIENELKKSGVFMSQ